MSSYSYDEDRNLLWSSSSELDEYLSSSVILWRLRGSNFPLCPGNLLLAMHRIDGKANGLLKQSVDLISIILQKRRSAWEKKIRAELPIRLEQWKSFLDDLQETGRIDPSYVYNVRTRVILDLLYSDLAIADVNFEAQLQLMDDTLWKWICSGDFVWGEDLAELFPKERFTYMYVKLKGEGR